MYEKSASQSGKVKQEAGKLAMVSSASFIISNSVLLSPVMPLFSKWVVAALLLILVLLFLERRCLVDVLDGGHGKFGLLGPERRQNGRQ